MKNIEWTLCIHFLDLLTTTQPPTFFITSTSCREDRKRPQKEPCPHVRCHLVSLCSICQRRSKIITYKKEWCKVCMLFNGKLLWAQDFFRYCLLPSSNDWALGNCPSWSALNTALSLPLERVQMCLEGLFYRKSVTLGSKGRNHSHFNSCNFLHRVSFRTSM